MPKREVNMLSGSVLKSIIAYTIPIILTNVLQLLFNAADLIVVGQFSGSGSVGAVGATGSVTNLIINLFVGISTGCGITAAQAIGAGNKEEIHKVVHTSVPVALIAGIFLSIVGVLGAEGILTLMGTPEELLPLSTVYMQIYFAGMTATMLYNFCAAILRAAGDTRSPLYFLLVSGVLNVVLNLIFVIFLKMDVAGVALATVISQAVSAILTIAVLLRRDDACKFYIKKMHIYKDTFFDFIRIGIPAGVQGSMYSIANVLVQSSINSLGAAVVAGRAAASNIEGFVYAIMSAFYQTVANFSGQNKGVGNFKRIKEVLYKCIICCSVCAFAVGVLVNVFSEQLLSVYITNSPEAIEAGKTSLFMLAIFYFVCGVQDNFASATRGMGVAVAPMVISIVGICAFRIIWISTVFVHYRTLESLLIIYPISWAITVILQGVCFNAVCKIKTLGAKH